MNCTDVKPVLSPRTSDNVTQALRSQPIISPKLLDSVNEERTPPHSATIPNNNNLPQLISPRLSQQQQQQQQSHLNSVDVCASSNFNRSPFQNTSHHRITSSDRISTYNIDDGASTSGAMCMYPVSPKQQNIAEIASINEFGPLPISPHVNVPNSHSFNHHVPPPLPPRRREKLESDRSTVRQAPDAPELPPRDLSPPPLPPRLSLIVSCQKSNTYNEESGILRQTPAQLKLPNTSTIMMRRNSALKEGSASSDGNTSTSSSTMTLHATISIDSQDGSSVKKIQPNASSAPPINRKPR